MVPVSSVYCSSRERSSFAQNTAKTSQSREALLQENYTVNHKKRDILFFTITSANRNRFLSFLYHFNHDKNSTYDCCKIYHITLIVCTPYFVKEHFSVKCYYSLFIYVCSKREQKKVISSYQIYSVAISTLLFDSSNHK